VSDCTGKADGTPCQTVGNCTGTDICCTQLCTDVGGVCPP
jgi:hypothetical protein